MSALTRLRIDGFRRLASIELFLKSLAVIIGANGVGKTSILEVLTFLRSSAERKTSDWISLNGGFSHIASLDRVSKTISVQVDCAINDQNVAYLQRLKSQGISYTWTEELVSLISSADADSMIQLDLDTSMFSYRSESGNLQKSKSHLPHEAILAQVPHGQNSLLDNLIELLSSITYFHTILIEPNSPIRTPQHIKPTALPGTNGEDLISCLYNIRIADRARFELVEDTLRAAFPTFEYIDFPPVAAGMLSMLWKDKQFTQPLYPHQLSEGTLRFLWLTALLYSPELPAVTLIDEPEVSLHPRMLSLLADMLREASQRAQIIVATQSESLVRFMRPEEVLVMDLDEEGHTTAKWADEMELGDWLEDYTLEKLWRIGLLEER